jgi:hypothetical protein
MSDRRLELIREEDARWSELCALLDGVPEERLLQVGVTADWSVKDLLAHLACWMAEAAVMLERIRFGTYESQNMDVDGINQHFHETWKDQDLRAVMAELESSRTRMFQEWGALAEITPDAEEWFVESGPEHLDEHVPDLRAFLSR